MLANQPAGTSAAHTWAAASTEIIWALALATARVAAASAARNLELWAHLLRPQAELPGLANPPPASPSGAAAAAGSPPATASAGAELIPFASYRSPGGHAAARVVVSD